MTVAELIERLSHLSPDAEARVQGEAYGETEAITDIEVLRWDDDPDRQFVLLAY